MSDDDRYNNTRNMLVVAIAVVLVAFAIMGTIAVVNVRNAQRDEAVRVACVNSGGDFYPEDGGKCVHIAMRPL